jgi:four helix bundle protein
MFHAYSNALELIRALVPVVEKLKTYDANIADQIVRAATSITLNVSEGSRRAGKDRRRFYVMARGSAGEIQGALDTADAWGWRVDTERARGILDRELRLLAGLCNERRRSASES